MKTAVAFSALVASTFAQSYFTVLSARSASPIHLQDLTARAGKFFLGGGPPSSYCPPSLPNGTCPAGNTTVLAGGVGSLSLGVGVPGGQQVYVAPDGTLSYTSPHSAYTPPGSVLDGWNRTNDENFGHLIFTGGLVACPAENGTVYQVYGGLPNVTFTPDCLGFNALTSNTTKTGAWEY